MILTLSQVLELCKTPKNREKLKKAAYHEKRINLHSEVITDKIDKTEAHTDFLKWSCSLIAVEKQELFTKLFRLPIQTNEVINDIFNEFAKLTNAQNKFIKHNLVNEDFQARYETALFESNLTDFWNTDYLEVLKTKPQSFIIIDKANDKPYFYVLSIEDVIDTVVKETGACEYIIFKQDITIEDENRNVIKKAVFIDDEKFILLEQTKTQDNYKQVKEFFHKCESTPAFKFYPSFSQKDYINSIVPISSILSGLDKLLFWIIAFDYFKLYGVFPIYWGYKKKCDYFDEKLNAYCEGGYLSYTVPILNSVDVENHKIECPSCKSKQLLGPGSFVEVDAPELKEQADLRDPVGKLDADINSAKFIEEYINKLEGKLKYAVTGKNFDTVMSKAAVNETQAESTLETRTEVLCRMARVIEKTMWNTYYYMGKIGYGTYYKNSTVDLGRKFFLQSTSELNEQYSNAKKIGKPMFELEQRQRFIYETAFQNNPDELMRTKILSELEPYQEFTFAELASLQIKESNPVDFEIKINFNKYIKQFENKNGDITTFGEGIEFSKKIETIKNNLIIYATKDIQSKIKNVIPNKNEKNQR